MTYLVIRGAQPWDGRYEFDLAENAITTREWGWIKRLTGYLPLTMDEGLDGADPELYAVFAAIALHRAGKIRPDEVPEIFDRFVDRPFDPEDVTLEADQVDEEEVLPPPRSSTPNGDSSGAASRTSSERSEATRPATGIPDLDSSGWQRIESAT